MIFKRPYLVPLTLSIACWGTPLAIAATEPEPPAGGGLTLTAAIDEALGQSPSLRLIEADIDSARGEALTAQQKPVPELSFTPGLKRTKDNATHHEFKGTVSYSQTLVFPGRRELLISIAERNVELRKLGVDGLRFQITVSVRKAFFELLAAQRVVSLRQQQLESAETFHQAARKRAESGYASDFEAVKSQGEVINARKLLAAAEGEVASSSVELNSLLGRTPTAPVELSGKLETANAERPLPDLLALALSQNPSLRVQEMQAELAGLNVRKARMARRTDISVGPSLEYSKSEQVLGISATIGLPAKNYGQGELLTATAEERKVSAETDRLRREITGAVTKAATRLATAERQLALYSPEYLDQLKGVAAQAEQSYAQNITSLLIYLDAKRTYFDTLADYYETAAAVANGRAELEAAVGVSLSNNPSH